MYIVEVVKKSLLLMCIVMLSMVGLASAADNPINCISVDGYGEVTATPDRANINIGIVSNAKTAKQAQQDNAAAANAVKAALQDLGIDPSDMKTSHYNFRPVYSQEKNKSHKVIGYTASCSLEVVVNDISQTGLVIDRALSNGANRVNNLNFDLKEPEVYRKEALRVALRDARAKADIIADELGIKIKGVKLVTESVGSVEPRADMTLAKMASAGAMDNEAPEPTPIEAGTIELGATVHIDYIIE